jgi:voltage-gated potassium channel
MAGLSTASIPIMRIRRLGAITQESWKSHTEWPITFCAVLFLAAYSWSVIGNVQGDLHEALEWVQWSVWVVFAIDYVMNFALAPQRWRWFYTHLPQFFVVALPALRPLRLLRLISLVSVLQRAAGMFMRGRVTIYVVGSAILLVYIASLAVLEAERPYPGSTIKNFGEAIWWAFVTITTVGYGDFIPVSFEGRAIAVGLMISGIALLGTITATIASWMVERVSTNDEAADQARDAITIEHIQALSLQVSALSEQIAALGGEPVSSRAPSGDGEHPSPSLAVPHG